MIPIRKLTNAIGKFIPRNDGPDDDSLNGHHFHWRKTDRTFIRDALFPKLNLTCHFELVKSLAQSVAWKQRSKSDALREARTYHHNLAEEELQEVGRPLLVDKQALETLQSGLETDKRDTEEELKKTQKLYNRKHHYTERKWSGWIFSLFAAMFVGSVFAGIFGILGVQRTLSATIAYMDSPFSAVLYSLVFALPPLVLKGLYGVVEEKDSQKKFIRYLAIANGISFFLFICLFSFTNAQDPDSTSTSLFTETEGPGFIARLLPPLSLISQLMVEVTTSSLLLVLAQFLENKNSTSQSRVRFQLTPEYLEKKAKLRKIEGHLLIIKRRLDGITSFFKEFEAAKTKLITEADASFHKYLRRLD